jgi:hypothetical protein
MAFISGREELNAHEIKSFLSGVKDLKLLFHSYKYKIYESNIYEDNYYLI